MNADGVGGFATHPSIHATTPLAGQAWSSCPDVLISLVNTFAVLVMRSMAARACWMLGGSADSQHRQASILIRRAAKDCLTSGATVADRPNSLTNWDTWKTGNPSCCSIACTNWSAFFPSTSANELLRQTSLCWSMRLAVPACIVRFPLDIRASLGRHVRFGVHVPIALLGEERERSAAYIALPMRRAALSGDGGKSARHSHRPPRNVHQRCCTGASNPCRETWCRYRAAWRRISDRAEPRSARFDKRRGGRD